MNNCFVRALLCAQVAGALGGCVTLPVTFAMPDSPSVPAFAQATAVEPRPMSLDELNTLPVEPVAADKSSEIRTEALRSAALSYGARGGLAYRAWQINKDLDSRADVLDTTFDFDPLMIPSPDGAVWIAPPVLAEASDAVIVAADGLSASASDRIYRIVQAASITSAVPDWRNYLLRNWDGVELPDAILRPRDDQEREIWNRLVADGWKHGVEQANQIFDRDLSRLERDLRGMALYRELVARGMIEELYIAEAREGVSGDGSVLRVGDRSVRITSPARLKTSAEGWKVVVVQEGSR